MRRRRGAYGRWWNDWGRRRASAKATEASIPNAWDPKKTLVETGLAPSQTAYFEYAADGDAASRVSTIGLFQLPLNRHRHRIPSAQAQRGYPAVDIPPDHLVDQSDQHTRAAGSDGMS